MCTLKVPRWRLKLSIRTLKGPPKCLKMGIKVIRTLKVPPETGTYSQIGHWKPLLSGAVEIHQLNRYLKTMCTLKVPPCYLM